MTNFIQGWLQCSILLSIILGLYNNGYQLDSERDEKPDEKYLPQSPDGLRYPIVILKDSDVSLAMVIANINSNYAKQLSVTTIVDGKKEDLVRRFANIY